MYKLSFFKTIPRDTVITILPHDTIDVDAAISAILLSKFLDFLNIKNEIVIFDKKVDKWTTYFLNKLGYDLTKFQNEVEDEKKTLFLVDHYKTIHKGKVIGCIDHHFTSEKLDYSYYLYNASCSTAYMIYLLMKQSNYLITKEIVELVGYASLVDTCSFKSTKVIQEEKENIIYMLKENKFDVEEMIKDCLCLDDLSKMSLEEIAFNGMKSYNYNKRNVKSSYIQIDSLEISDIVLDFLMEVVKKENLDMWVFIVFDMINEKTLVYKITRNSVVKEKFGKIMSRGKDIMPVVEKSYYN